MTMKTKSVIGFIDDDLNELKRFKKAFKNEFECALGTTAEECKRELTRLGVKPDLWVLDLYFPGPGAPKTDATKMAGRYAKVDKSVRDFKSYLAIIGQGPEGGMKLLRDCLRDYQVPVVMLTRKGTLEDAISCLDAGATAVLKKPMPPKLKGTPAAKKRQLDDAMLGDAKELAQRFNGAITADRQRKHMETKQAFVAMWYSQSMDEVYAKGIMPALISAKLEPYRADHDEHNQKIDEKIMTEIRRSRILVADFTGHRGGVYFETGFAMGLGIPVIWTCKYTDIKKTHFDTRQYNHVVWTTSADLNTKLGVRLAATIK